jgi:putative colanic acid biosynthesis acetyltransferase WcaF
MNPPTRSAMTTLEQADAYSTPWTMRERLGLLLWRAAWTLLCAWTPKPLYRWRNLVLRLFGAHITGTPFVAASARISFPWRLTLEDRACLGAQCVVYNLGAITVRARATVAQESYLCAGSHDFADPALPLTVAPIEIGADAFIGVRAVVLPGVNVGTGAIIGAAAVVTRSQPAWQVCAGNPCKALAPRAGAERFPSHAKAAG